MDGYETGPMQAQYGFASEERLGALGEIDRELERLAGEIDRCGHILAPIRNQYDGPEKVMSAPRAEPATQLRGRTERLRDLTNTLSALLSEVDL